MSYLLIWPPFCIKSISFPLTPAEGIVIGLTKRVGLLGATNCLTHLSFLNFLCLQHLILADFSNIWGDVVFIISYAILLDYWLIGSLPSPPLPPYIGAANTAVHTLFQILTLNGTGPVPPMN